MSNRLGGLKGTLAINTLRLVLAAVIVVLILL
jgi:hypothetical protein